MLCLGLLSLTLAQQPPAQPKDSRFMNVATGSPTGTYAKIYKDMGKICTQASYLLERGTSGTLENIELLLSNQVSMAFLQVDALEAKKQIDQDPRVDQIKALIPLYPEEVHIIVRADLANVTGNFLTKKKVPVSKISELKGKTVGAWGGSFVTAKVLNAKGGNFKQLLFFDGKTPQADGLAALTQGKIEAIIAVGGQPVTWIRDLPAGQFRLLQFDLKDIPERIYKPARISYPNLNTDSVQTISVQSLLATRDFKTVERAKLLTAYRQCVIDKITELREGEGNHPKWSVVEPGSDPPWPKYDPVVK
jgi:hypothetical protein